MIEVKLYGCPVVSAPDGVREISLKKSEAVLYYIGYKERVTRDEVINLIWPDVAVATAKKNLRNCLYRLKKDLDIDVFICPNKNTIHINREVISFDVHDENAFHNNYQGRFLENFSLQDSETFESWVRDTEQSFNQRFIQWGEDQMKAYLVAKQFDEAVLLGGKIYQIDTFNENLVRMLLTLYDQNEDYSGMISCYQSLKQNLEDELGITPDVQTTELFNNLMHQRQNNTSHIKPIFGREDEIHRIVDGAKHYLLSVSNGSHAFIISGEAGVGKTTLSETVISNLENDFLVFSANCYQFDSAFNLKAWNDVMSEMNSALSTLGITLQLNIKKVLAHVFPSFVDDEVLLVPEQFESVQYGYVEKVVCRMINQMTLKKPLLIRFEDIQWMDGMGIRLLNAVLLHCKRVVVIATMRNEISNEVDSMIQTLNQYQKLDMVKLERFERERAYDFISYLAEKPTDSALMQKIFEESEGNAFFIVEMMKLEPEQQLAFDKKLSDLLGARFLGLSEEAMKVANIIAMFFDGATFDMLNRLYAKDQDTLFEMIEQLKKRYLIVEQLKEGLPFYTFTHHKLSVYLYEMMGVAKRNMLHHRIAEQWKSELGSSKRDMLIYQKLIYHYKASDDVSAHLSYYLSYLEKYFDVSHEMYPEAPNLGLEPFNDQPELCFSQLNQLIYKANQRHLDIKKLESRYHLLYGRYLIRQGYYEVGLKEIKQLLSLAETIGENLLIYKGYVQWVYYAIQVGDASEMEDALGKILQVTSTDTEKAIVTRFKGIHMMMIKQYDQARQYFKASIEILNTFNDMNRYALNIAAAYNYIADSYRYEEAYDAALQSVGQAIAICDQYDLNRGKAIFNTNAGIITYLSGLKEESKTYLKNALQLYENMDILWRRGTAEAYMGLIELSEGNHFKAKEYLKMAAQHAVMINNPETQEVIYSLEASLRTFL